MGACSYRAIVGVKRGNSDETHPQAIDDRIVTGGDACGTIVTLSLTSFVLASCSQDDGSQRLSESHGPTIPSRASALGRRLSRQESGMASLSCRDLRQGDMGLLLLARDLHKPIPDKTRAMQDKIHERSDPCTLTAHHGLFVFCGCSVRILGVGLLAVGLRLQPRSK